jgi:PilZ domain-containing protein
MNNAAIKATSALRLPLPKLLKSKKQTYSRRHNRHECVVIGTMKIIEIGAEFDGALLEISRGGCTFRQASMFVLDRVNQPVLVHTEFFELEGKIRAVRPEGYGVQFFGEVEDGVIDRIIADYGFNVADSFLAKRN